MKQKFFSIVSNIEWSASGTRTNVGGAWFCL